MSKDEINERRKDRWMSEGMSIGWISGGLKQEDLKNNINFKLLSKKIYFTQLQILFSESFLLEINYHRAFQQTPSHQTMT